MQLLWLLQPPQPALCPTSRATRPWSSQFCWRCFVERLGFASTFPSHLELQEARVLLKTWTKRFTKFLMSWNIGWVGEYLKLKKRPCKRNAGDTLTARCANFLMMNIGDTSTMGRLDWPTWRRWRNRVFPVQLHDVALLQSITWAEADDARNQCPAASHSGAIGMWVGWSSAVQWCHFDGADRRSDPRSSWDDLHRFGRDLKSVWRMYRDFWKVKWTENPMLICRAGFADSLIGFLVKIQSESLGTRLRRGEQHFTPLFTCLVCSTIACPIAYNHMAWKDFMSLQFNHMSSSCGIYGCYRRSFFAKIKRALPIKNKNEMVNFGVHLDAFRPLS